VLWSVGDGLIVSWYTNVPGTPPLLHPAPPNHFNGRLRISFRINTSKWISRCVHSKQLIERTKPFRIRTYAKPGGRTQGSAHAFFPSRPFAPTHQPSPFCRFCPLLCCFFSYKYKLPNLQALCFDNDATVGGVGVPVSFTVHYPNHVRSCPVLGTNSLRQTQQELSSLGSAQPIVPNQLLVRGQVAELLRRHDFSPAPSSIPHREWLLVQSRGTKFRRPSIQS